MYSCFFYVYNFKFSKGLTLLKHRGLLLPKAKNSIAFQWVLKANFRLDHRSLPPQKNNFLASPLERNLCPTKVMIIVGFSIYNLYLCQHQQPWATRIIVLTKNDHIYD